MRDALALAARELVRAAVGGDVGVEPDVLQHLADLLLARSALEPIFQMSSGSITMSFTLRRGFSDEIGSWKIICTLVRSTRICSPLERREVLPVEHDRARRSGGAAA